MPYRAAIVLSALSLAALAATAGADTCVECHEKQHPGIVADWKTSKHAQPKS